MRDFNRERRRSAFACRSTLRLRLLEGSSRKAVVLDVARTPEQRLPVRAGREVQQPRVADRVSGKLQLIRVTVDSDQDGDTIVTVYRASKLREYWRTQ